MDTEFHSTLYNGCNYLSMLGLKWIYVRKGSMWYIRNVYWECEPFRLSLQWRHNGRDGVSYHRPRDCLPNRLFIRRSKKISKLPVTGLCAGNSPLTGKFPVQMASNAENVSIWWRHHEMIKCLCIICDNFTSLYFCCVLILLISWRPSRWT